MSFKQTLLALSAISGLVTGTQAAAQPAWRGGWHEVLAAAQLSSAQKQQVHQLRQAARAQNASQRTQLRALHQQIEQALLAPGSVTAAQLMPLVQQQEALRQQLDASRLQTELAIRNLMTSAQLAQAESARAQLATLHQQERALVQPQPVTP